MAQSIFSGEKRMLETLNGQSTLLALSVTLLIVLMTAGYLVIKYIRGATIKDDISEADLAQNFEEMRREGDISESEFRTIQAVIGKSQSSNSSGTGTA
jgi:uncharacterized membrane protein